MSLPSNLSVGEAERFCFMQFAPGSAGRFLFGLAEEAAEDDIEQVETELQEQLDAANAEAENLSGQLKESEEEVEALRSQLVEADEEIGNLNEKLAAEEREVENLNEQLARVRA